MNVQYLFETYGFWPFVIALATMVLTSFAKIPVKLLINKIKSRTVRDLVERLILLIPVGIGIGLYYLKNFILKSGEGDVAIVMAGAACGALAIVYYNLFGKYIELWVIKLFKKNATFKDDGTMGQEALDAAIAIASGKPIENVVKDLINHDTESTNDTDAESVNETEDDTYDDDEDYDNDPDESEVIELVCEYTGADEELVATILAKLKN